MVPWKSIAQAPSLPAPLRISWQSSTVWRTASKRSKIWFSRTPVR
jgi:hypothetical protein